MFVCSSVLLKHLLEGNLVHEKQKKPFVLPNDEISQASLEKEIYFLAGHGARAEPG